MSVICAGVAATFSNVDEHHCPGGVILSIAIFRCGENVFSNVATIICHN